MPDIEQPDGDRGGNVPLVLEVEDDEKDDPGS